MLLQNHCEKDHALEFEGNSLSSPLPPPLSPQAVEEFARSVDSLCAAQRAEVAPEMQLLRASMALGLYIKKTCPDLRPTIQSCMAAFINTRLAGWINQQGGWVSTK